MRSTVARHPHSDSFTGRGKSTGPSQPGDHYPRSWLFRESSARSWGTWGCPKERTQHRYYAIHKMSSGGTGPGPYEGRWTIPRVGPVRRLGLNLGAIESPINCKRFARRKLSRTLASNVCSWHVCDMQELRFLVRFALRNGTRTSSQARFVDTQRPSCRRAGEVVIDLTG